jgi:hypothetical protein
MKCAASLSLAAALLFACSSGGSGGVAPGTDGGNGGADGGVDGNGNTTKCPYPAGPYGTQVGDVVDGSLSWAGYVDDAAQATTVTMSDYYDCDGTKGINAVLVDESAVWCGDCISEAMQIAPMLSAQWKSEGVKLVVLMAQNADTANPGPASLEDALTWRNEFALITGTAVCADPQWTERVWGIPASSGAENGFPTNTIVDPRTMKIVAIQPASVFGTVDNLAKANGGS